MATKSKNKKRKSPFSDARQPEPPKKAEPAPQSNFVQDPGRRWFLIALFLTIAVGGGIIAMIVKDARLMGLAMNGVEQYTYEIVQEYPHDPLAFTQGLFFHDGKMYESTGRYGESTMRLVDLETGTPERRILLGKETFGEGCVLLDDRIYQLTWKEQKCLVYDLDLKLQTTFDFEGEGWGLTTDGENLIMTDGTSKLIYRNPEDFSIIKKVFIKLGTRTVSRLNEMEYVGGKIYANKYESDSIYEIDPKSGKVTAIIDLTGLWPSAERPQGGVLNGIAQDPARHPNVFVTGKYCPKLFEIEFVAKEDK